MKVSYNWLQTYFKEPLPMPEKLAELFTFRFAEVESVDKYENDSILDVKVLPDRAHYALCHKGIATEVAAITGLVALAQVSNFAENSEKKVVINIENEMLCRRYSARYIENVSVGASPAWLAKSLAAIGQRSINNIVDATNFAMFDVGQPLHAFDADKVSGAIVVRMAKAGEKITTLDNKEITLTPEILVIADEAGPLALAGIKGGKRAEVDANTKNIILEAANFDPAYVRKASSQLGVRTESSKRYENEITPEWTTMGADRCIAIMSELLPDAKIGEVVDVYPIKSIEREIIFDPISAHALLGVAISEEEIKKILFSFGISAKNDGKNLILSIPPERLDLLLPEDIIEEIGRIHGYENIPPVAPPKRSHDLPILKSFYYTEKIRDSLIALGFSEVFTYSFRKSGAIEIEKSLASDKNFLRQDLQGNMIDALEFNAHYVDLINLDEVKLFEIGKVFGVNGEERIQLAIGVRKVKKEKGVTGEKLVSEATAAVDSALGIVLPYETLVAGQDATAQITLDAFFETLPEPAIWNIVPYEQKNITYKKISAYPFMVRDVALFVPIETRQGDIAELLRNQAGELLANLRLFDIFTKTFPDGTQKTSYAFRLVFQSYEKTLSDDEANAIMERINTAVAKQGWEVR